MATVPTNRLERELRKAYLQWLAGLSDQTDVTAYIGVFEQRSKALIERLGGQASSLGALADFPVPKTLELSPRAGVVYDEMRQAAISASITAGLNATDAARQMLNAGMDKSFNRLNRLARTETVSAYWKNSWDSIADLPLLVMVWGSESSKRTCDYCLSRDGLVVEQGDIRDHPNGRCTLIPTLRSQVKYKGTLQPDGSVDQDPRWSKKPAIESMDFTPEEIRTGTLAAERQRVALEKGMFNKKGMFNAEKGWTSETRQSWSSYIEGGGKEMNSLLRDPKAFAKTDLGSDPYFSGLLRKQADDLSDLISKNQLTDDVVVSRGVVNAPGFDPSKLRAGDNFTDSAFMSTTTDLTHAADFATGRGSGAEGWTFITKAPKGTNAVAGADYQKEIVFKAGQPQRVLGVDAKARTIYTEMTVDAKAAVKLVPQQAPVKTFGSQVDKVTLKKRISEGDWRYIDDRKQRSAALLQNDFRAEQAIKKAALNIKEGRPALDGVGIPKAWSKEFTGNVTDVGVKYTEANVREAIEDAAGWLAEQETVSPRLMFKGLDVPKDKIAKLFKEGGSFDTNYSSFTTDEVVARKYSSSRASQQVIVRVKKAPAIKVDGNPTAEFWKTTKEHLVSGQGRIVRVVDDGRTVYVDVEF